MTAGDGTSPYMLYSGWDGRGEFFFLMEICYCGIPGRPIGDGIDGHSWWPLFQSIPTEYLEAYYPVRIDGYTSLRDSGGAGLHRGGKRHREALRVPRAGRDLAARLPVADLPVGGVLGGRPAMRSAKLLVRADGTSERLPAKCDEIAIEPGDMLVYRTAAAGETRWSAPGASSRPRCATASSQLRRPSASTAC